MVWMRVHCLRPDTVAHERSRDYWARNVSLNKYVKIYIGAPGATGSADRGYVPISTLKTIAVQMRRSYPSFGGVMLWDASQAYGEKSYLFVGVAVGCLPPRRLLPFLVERELMVSGVANGRYDMGVKNGLISAGGVGFKRPACSAPVYTSGQVYTAGSQVSFDG